MGGPRLKFSIGTKLPFLVSAGLIALSCPTYSSETDENAAVTASKQWLSIVDKGQYGQSWDQAAGFFKANIKKKDFETKLKASRGQFGELVSRKLKSKQYTASMPGAPDGKYVVIQYETSFSGKKDATETITPMLDKDGQWKVSGYFIK
jgi:hypothetical protein